MELTFLKWALRREKREVSNSVQAELNCAASGASSEGEARCSPQSTHRLRLSVLRLSVRDLPVYF